MSIVVGLIAGIVGGKIFAFIWRRFDHEEPPEAKHRDVSVPRLAFALLLEGAIFRAARGLFDHQARRSFERATGKWPGEIEPDPS